MPRYLLRVAYLGTWFHGWQQQPGKRTVQQELAKALRSLWGCKTPPTAAGRTDRGVHAKAQAVHVDLPHHIPPEGVVKALNSTLPWDVRTTSARLVPPDFHARRDAKSKLYVYRLALSPAKYPWSGLLRAVIPGEYNEEALNRAVSLIASASDLRAFTVRGAPLVPGPIYEAHVRNTSYGFELSFKARAFMRYQVRRMVGAALEVARGKMTLQELERLMAAGEPGAPVPTAPACGLTLEHVSYAAVLDSAPRGYVGS